MIDASKIDWTKVYIPEGRSKKAVQCMLDVAKKAVKNGDLDGAASGKAVPNSKAVEAGLKRKRTKKQSKGVVDEQDDTEDEDLVKKQKFDSEEEVEVKKQGEIEEKIEVKSEVAESEEENAV